MNEREANAVYDRLRDNQQRINKLEAQNKELLEALKQTAYCASHQCGFGCNPEKCPDPLRIQALITKIEGNED